MKKIVILTSFMCFIEVCGEINIAKLLPPDYDVSEAPFPKDGSPIAVGIGWNIKGILEVNFREMTILASMYLRVRWEEPRLIPNAEAYEVGQSLPLHSSFLKKVWLPDLYIHEATEIRKFSMMQDLQGAYIQENYTIVFSALLQTRLACPMYFYKYPFDAQTCTLSVSSYMLGENKLQLEWMKIGVTADKEVNYQVPSYNFHIVSSVITSKHWCETEKCEFRPSSIARVYLQFERRYAGHVLAVYLPSGITVSLAYMSFYWPPEVVPGRTVLVITSLLTMISMYGNVLERSPETSYMKAVDVWLVLCILHIALALFQYAVILTIRRRQKETNVGNVFIKSKSPKIRPLAPFMRSASGGSASDQQGPSPPLTPRANQPSSAYRTGGSSVTLRLVFHEHYVERAGQLGLPILFLLCCLVYWPCYLS
ncbi:glycine receptor subunit alpha-2-like [Macrobrachium nipponense]|uniref:glycine receptor subunit alpha-2-like n=1 Tax=Macrobrachium nipponense TaxID=159736 RepID=UPI0030C7E54C